MTKQEALTVVNNVFNFVKQNNNENIKTAKKLEIVLLNLKIMEAHIGGHTGMRPIIDELEKNIREIDQSVSNLVSQNRDTLEQALKILNNNNI